MKPLACTTCNTIGKPKLKTPGSFVMELLLLIFGILGGLLIMPLLFILIPVAIIYSLYRSTKRTKVCRACGATTLVPLNTPAGKAISKNQMTS